MEETTEKKGNNSMAIIAMAIVGILVVGGGLFFLNQSPNNTGSNQTQQPAQQNTITETPNNANGTSELTEDEVKEFTVRGNNFEFDVTEMRVNKGDTVRVTFVNEEGMHDWMLDEFDVGTPILQAGGSETVEFVADQAGKFEYYCSVGDHRQMGMVGTLIVEE